MTSDSVISTIRAHADRLKQRSRKRPVRVLVVDDEASILRFVSRVLQDAGYETTTASDGLQALQVVAESEPFDLLLTDLKMPEMTGDELARRCRQKEPSLKVLYLTGFSDQLFKDRLGLWEGEAFLDKPSSVSGILEAVSLVLYGTLLPPRARARRLFFGQTRSSESYASY